MAVPTIIKKIQRTNQPNKKEMMANFLSLKVRKEITIGMIITKIIIVLEILHHPE